MFPPTVRQIFRLCLLGLCLHVQSVISEPEPQQNKYTVKPQRELKSRFVTQQEKKKQDAEAALLQKQTPLEVTVTVGTEQTGHVVC